MDLGSAKLDRVESGFFETCIDMHGKDLKFMGEQDPRLYELNAWEEGPFYTDRERAAFAIDSGEDGVSYSESGSETATASDFSGNLGRSSTGTRASRSGSPSGVDVKDVMRRPQSTKSRRRRPST